MTRGGTFVVGATTVGDVRRWLYDALAAHGVTTWFQPDLRVQRRDVPSPTSRGFLPVAQRPRPPSARERRPRP